MTADERLRRSSYHEAGHVVVGHLRGYAPGPVTVVGGSTRTGCANPKPPLMPDDLPEFDAETLPFLLWPEPVQQRITSEALICCAGLAAEGLLRRPVQPEPEPENLVADDVLPEMTDDELAWADMAVSLDAPKTDGERAEQWALTAFPDPVARHAWMAVIHSQVDQMVAVNAALINRIADRLAEAGTLSAQATGLLVKHGGLGLVCDQG